MTAEIDLETADLRTRASVVAQWLRLVQGELADMPPGERRQGLAETVEKAFAGRADRRDAALLLDELERRFPIPDGGVGAGAPADGVAAVVSAERLDSSALIDAILGRWDALAEVDRGRLQARAGGVGAPDPDLRRQLGIADQDPFDLVRLQQAMAMTLKHLAKLHEAFRKQFGGRWSTSSGEKVVTPDPPARAIADFVAGRRTRESCEAAVANALLAPRSVIESVEVGLQEMPETIRGLEPTSIERDVKRDTPAGWMTTGPDGKDFWKRYRDLARERLTADGLRTAYMAEIACVAAENYRNKTV